MFNESWLNLIQQQRAIAVIRASKLAQAYEMAMAVAKAGMQVIEITWNSDRPEKLIKQLRTELPTCSIGAGTLLTLEEIKQAIPHNPQRLLLDNMSNEQMAEALKIIPKNIETEASGNMNLTRVRSVAELGVTYISVGALTHSAPCSDVSLLFDWSNV